MQSSFLSLLCLLCLFVADWPQFRGPTGQGVSEERGLPLSWSESKNVRWKVAIPGRGWSSPVIRGDRIWLTTATDISKSKVVWRQELWRARLGGNHSASPIYADVKIYFLSEEGESVVIAPGRQLKHLATNQLDGPTLASMAVSGGSLFIRSATHLYRITN